MWFWLAACRVPPMVEVPGGAVPGPARTDEPEWSWPAEVPALAGCSWTESDPEGDTVVWTYDAAGRLASEASLHDGVSTLATHSWRRGCLVDTTVDRMGSEATPRDTVATVDVYACDRHDNKVAWEEHVRDADGALVPLPGQTRTFVNGYDALDQLATVETWLVDDPLGLATVDTITWNADAQPLVQVREEPIAGVKTTWTWWWDHALLLGRDEEGTGADTYITRTWEGHRLTGESVTSDLGAPTRTTWDYTGTDNGFPTSKQTFSDSVQIGDRRIEVSCAD